MPTRDTAKADSRRRMPTQARAQHTRALILEAAIRLLEQRGLRAFSTNLLADASGFSVGTIYQYFANKRAVLDAVAQHERQRRHAHMLQILAQHKPLLERIRLAMRTELHAFDGRQRALRIVFEHIRDGDSPGDIDGTLALLADQLVAGGIRDDAQRPIRLSSLDAFVLTQAVAGVVRATLSRDARHRLAPALEDAITSLIAGFLAARRLP